MSLSQDQFRFLAANLAGLTLAIPYKHIPKTLLNEYNYLPGIVMLYYCFGRQANSLFLFSAISYAICKYTPRNRVQHISLWTSIGFLSYAHLSRQIIDYGGYVLDISGPFMIAVQKMTSLGFCLYDGRNVKVENDISSTTKSKRDHQTLTEEQKKYAIADVPSFNEFMGYFFHFPSVLCGPIMYFQDYSDFVKSSPGKKVPPGRIKAVLTKLAISASCAILHLTLSPKFEVEFLRSPGFLIHTHFVVRFYYIFIFTVLSRLKYYVAWHLGESISNATGFGFNGHDYNGKPKWDLISNMDLWKFETCLNMRDAIHAWNKTTQTWLRRTAYERVPRRFSLVATYTLSAVWHGFYPGYYMTFMGGALFTHAARTGRHIVRPLFQRGKILPRLYDAVTFILTRLTIAYVAFPFVILDFRNNFEIYRSLYFSLHILALSGVILGLAVKKK